MVLSSCRVDSPVGPLEITASADSIVSVSFVRQVPPPALIPPSTELLSRCAQELDEYFSGTRKAFTVPCQPAGTPFQMRAWEVLNQIPYGQTMTYGQQAARLQQPKAAQAVGLCNGANPLAIIVPCHRVVGANSRLTGYAAGLPIKQWLLDHERRHSPTTGQTYLF